MMLRDKTAVVYGAGGAVGSAVAKAFARAGAAVVVTGKRLQGVETLAAEIRKDGGRASAAAVDALDETAVDAHLASVTAETGGPDISFNAVGLTPQRGIQGRPLTELDVDSFMRPVTFYLRSHFVTARAAARRMGEGKGGVILMHTPSPARVAVPLVGGMAPAWAALEALTRSLSVELAQRGVRVVCLRSTGLPETATIDEVFGLHASALGIPQKEFLAMIERQTHRGRSTTLDELTQAAVFAASDAGTALTGTTINLTAGLVTD